MGKSSKILMLLLICALTFALVGCGGQDEEPAADKTSQTKAMVPESVIQHDEAEEIQPINEIPVEEADPQEVIALEPAAAEPVEIIEETVAPAPTAAPAGDGIYSLQLGSYTIAAFAEEKAGQLRDLGHPATVEQAEVGGQLYHRVFIRGLVDHQSAEKLGEELHTSLGLSYLIRRK